jgi:Flp pilus assembly protein TadD
MSTLPNALLLIAAVGLCACSTTTSRTELRDDGGFTITEQVTATPDVRADFESALRFLELGQYESGIPLLVRVAEAAPDLIAAHIDLGIAYGQTNDLARAEASLERALALNRRHPVAHNELGIVYRKAGRFEEARESYERALELYPGFHYARRNLAILCDVYLADPECALANYTLYAAAVPSDESASIWLADVRNRMGK